jgi:ribosomal protein S12 methylthiotransferase accessory factor
MESIGLDMGVLTERTADLKELIEECCRKIENCGHEVILFDMTRREIGVPVVRAIIPGLRHREPRLAPGRLFDVPVRMGWLRETCAEGALRESPG